MKKLLAIAVLVAACGGATDPLPSGSVAAFAPPMQDPEFVRKADANAYLAAAETSTKASKVLERKYKTFGTLKRARAFYKAAARIDGAFIANMKLIAFPDDMKGDVQSMIAKWIAVQALDIEGSGVKSWAAQANLASDLRKANRAATAASNLVRSELGLGSVHLRPNRLGGR